MVAVFKEFSELLCGFPTLPDSLAKDYFDLLMKQENDFLLLLEAFKKIKESDTVSISNEITKLAKSNSNFRLLIQKIIKLWYLGNLPTISSSKGERHYFHYEALLNLPFQHQQLRF
jgi:hypothetical protein